MWRRCDLHIHSFPNEQFPDIDWDPTAFVTACLERGVEVAAVTDHDTCERVDSVIQAARGTDLRIIAGTELSTDRGHILALSPGDGGLETIEELISRTGCVPGEQIEFDGLVEIFSGRRGDGTNFSESLVLIGAHVDSGKSLLSRDNTFNLRSQLEAVSRLHGLEVVSDETRTQWQVNGVKDSGESTALLRGSDIHDPDDRRPNGTWIYLPDVSVRHLKHALAVAEASVSLGEHRPERPSYVVESISFEGGHHDGVEFRFSERSNALIGPPNSGKSLVVDALKFVFDKPCEIPEVEAVTTSRMKGSLPEGTRVRVVVRTPSGVETLERVVGGAHAPQVPFTPIIFSQTELTRRGNAAEPAVQLLDMHSSEIGGAVQVVNESTDVVRASFGELLDLANQAKGLSSEVRNAEDGLEVTESEVLGLLGAEATARLATDAEKVRIWRDGAVRAVDEWEANTNADRPEFPSIPDIVSEDPDLSEFLPSRALEATANRVVATIEKLVSSAATQMRELLAEGSEGFEVQASSIETELVAQGFESGEAFREKFDKLTQRAATLSAKKQELEALESQITEGITRLHGQVGDVWQARERLTEERKKTCRSVNKSMRQFFAKLDPDGRTQKLDELFNDLKIGTGFRIDTRRKAIENLDRGRVLETAIRHMQGIPFDSTDKYEEQDQVVVEAMSRGKRAELVELACLYPGDQLEINWLGSSPPTPFDGLTEGLRSLAVKEISFSASDLPVITDQPEDAVPTRSIYENLVPTIREQRIGRQFILVSHDANIVVTADVESITSLAANQDGSPHAGDLFDEGIRLQAMEHLEGGKAAFERRAKRYLDLGLIT